MALQVETGSDATLPTVSTVITTRDRPELLREAIAAVEAQTYRGVIETVVVFDQSEPDESVASDDPKRPVRVMANARTPGLPGGRNTGAHASTGDFLCWCDDDDVWTPTKVERQVDLFNRRTWLDACFTGITIDHVTAGTTVPRVPDVDELTFAMLLRSRVMEAHISTAMCRREAYLDRIGDVDESIPGGYYEDYDWTMRAARDRPIGIVRAPLVRVRWTGASFFMDRFKTIDLATQYMLEKFPEFNDDPVGLSRMTGQQAFYRAASGQRRAALDSIWTTLRTNWKQPRAPLALLVIAGVDPNAIIRVLNTRGRSV